MNRNNRLRLYALASSSNIHSIIDERKYKGKKYTHFDRKVSFEKIKDKIMDPCWIKKHGFFPFIHFQINFIKYSKKKKKKKYKSRDIYYASHLDSFIYKYYGDILNEKYNKVVEELKINNVATAYRNNLSGKSNIHFAKEVVDFIVKQSQAYIYVADFTDFFDSLDHKYLKNRLKDVINLDSLPDDLYAVYKNITKFSFIEKEQIDKALKEKYKNGVPKLSRFFDEEEFREFKKMHLNKNTKSYGIPQGAGISSVFSNIYLLEFDQIVNDFVSEKGGIYRRYCDDLIIVLPIDSITEYDNKSVLDFITNVKDGVPNLKIQGEKTEEYFYTNNRILDAYNKKNTLLDYLGFSFDGYNVKIREKSLFKYYSRAYKKVRICNRLTQQFNHKAQRRSLYKNYTHLGKNSKGHGNFLSYAYRAQRVFDNNSSTNNLMQKQVKNHWKKINARLI